MRLVDRLEQIGPTAWSELLAHDPDATPLLRYEFLDALHRSGCASERTGWTPSYVTLFQGERLAAAAPLYRKDHSFGEYVFDWAWARAHQERGLPYYPKWLVAVPFTPASGSRLLARDEHARAALADALVDLARKSKMSSLHVLLAPPAQVEALAAAGLMLQPGVQFHWRNAGYADFDQFLSALAQDKRKKIRAERRKVQEAGVTLTRRVGRQITDQDWHFFHHCYCITYARHDSTPYLNLEFFLQLARTMPENLMLVLARHEGQPVASAFAVFGSGPGAGTLYGRYWGATAFIPCLHFECCYYQMIEFAIEQRLALFEGGAQGVHKMARGLDAVPTWSAHYVADPVMRRAIAAALDRQAREVGRAIDELAERSALKLSQAASG